MTKLIRNVYSSTDCVKQTYGKEMTQYKSTQARVDLRTLGGTIFISQEIFEFLRDQVRNALPLESCLIEPG